MGLSYVTATVRHPSRRGGGVRVRCLVDTGAIFTVLPQQVWQKLRLEPLETADFTLADGTVVRRGYPRHASRSRGARERRRSCWVTWKTRHCSAPSLLETLGLMVNPLSRRVLPMRMTLAAAR
jgi:hypothetical protein